MIGLVGFAQLGGQLHCWSGVPHTASKPIMMGLVLVDHDWVSRFCSIGWPTSLLVWCSPYSLLPNRAPGWVEVVVFSVLHNRVSGWVEVVVFSILSSRAPCWVEVAVFLVLPNRAPC